MVKQSQTERPRPVKLTAAILMTGVAATMAACSSSPSTSSSTHTPAPRTTSPASPTVTATASAKTCKHVHSLRGSLESLNSVQLNTSAAGKIRSDLTNINTQLHALKSEGSGTLSAQVGQLSTSVDQVQKAANGLSNPPSASQVNAIVNSLHGLRAQSQSAVAAMQAACPK